MDWLRRQIAGSPKRAMVLGKSLFLVGCILVLGAVFARAGLSTVNAERADAKLPPLRLAQAWPKSPTWIVPEGPLGFGIAAALVLAGAVVTSMADGARKRK